MANVLYLLVLLASLAAADDTCDVTRCPDSSQPLCVRNDVTDRLALFANSCVLRCASCRLRAAGTEHEFEIVNTSSCDNDVEIIDECPTLILNNDDEEEDSDVSDEGIMAVDLEISEASIDGDEVPPMRLEGDLPLGLASILQSEMFRRMLMAGPAPPKPPPAGGTLVEADVKVDVVINVNPPRAPAPQPLWMAPPPAAPMTLLLPLPLPLPLQDRRPAPVVYAAAAAGPSPALAVVAAALALAAASVSM